MSARARPAPELQVNTAGSARDVDASAFPEPPPDPQLLDFLDRYAPLREVPLCPEIRAFRADSLVAVWEAAETLAGGILPSPFWAFPWPAGIAIARLLMDHPQVARGRSVIDMGAGGGVSCLAAARAGARRVVACDVDPWALAVARLAAQRQALQIETLQDDPAQRPERLDPFDLVLCADLAYDGRTAARERAALQRAVERGATVLVANAGRKYFDGSDWALLLELVVPVTPDLEGVAQRTARVHGAGPGIESLNG